MGGRVADAMVAMGRVLRDIGSAMRGTMPPLRSPDGTFGTQRMQSEARAAQRRQRYPGD